MTWQWRSRRSAILLGDFALHVALFLWIFLHVMPSPPRAKPAGLSVLSLAAPGTAPSPDPPGVKPARPIPADPPPAATAVSPRSVPPPSVQQRVEAILGIQSSALTPAAAPATPSPGAASDMCDLTPTVQTALVADPDAVAAAHSLPPAILSMANAYMLWDAGWVPPRADAPSTGLDPIRKVLVEQVAAATQECRDQLQIGPRLIIVGTDSTAVTFVVGSGIWHWGDLTSPDLQNSPSLSTNSVVINR